jgi:CheY-like chemotaxis protein/MinD-like ATPase involved in chromosome partitioning or flagellar assembly
MAAMADKILIVDDDPATIEFFSVYLKKQGYEPLVAYDGMKALEIAHAQNPDLIILDVMMPGMDGYEVARSLRRHPETALIPILMFTAKTQVDDKLTGYEAGVDIYLTKPIHMVELQANIKALLTQSRARSDELAKRGYVVGVIATKGGLGVSTVALNLAIAYRQNQHTKVIAAEMRPGQGYWVHELGLADYFGIADLLRMDHAEITEAVLEKYLHPNMYGVPLLVATNNVCDVECVTALTQFEAIVRELSQMADLVVLDIGTDFHPAYSILTDHCDEIVLVTEPQPLTIEQTKPLIKQLKNQEFGSAKVLTMITVNRLRSEMSLTVSEIEQELGHSVTLGIPPMPELSYQSATQLKPMYVLHPEGIIATQINKLADAIAQHAAGQ